MGQRWVLASRNAGKLAELRRILESAGLPHELVDLSEAGVTWEVAETGATFAENALIKARAAHAATGLPAVADDSGLAVDALNGMPGVLSARWAGKHGDDDANLDLLLQQVADVPEGRRGAAFVCAAAFVEGDRETVVEGWVTGRLIEERRGTNGFGYDPVFVPVGEHRTTAEMSAEEKDAISHRGRAFRALAAALGGVVEGDTGLQSDVLEDLTEAVNYRAWLVGLAQPYLGDAPLEIGSGVGAYAADWADAGVRITASEADPGRLAHLRERFPPGDAVTVRELAVPIDEDASYSAVVALNVLEHIPDDVAALRSFARLVRPGGRIVLVVPAFPAAMSRFDRAIGHQRRYRRATLRHALEQAGLEVEVLHHVNSLGLPAWFVGMRLLGMRPQAGIPLTVYDRWVVPALRRAEARRPPPFGQSLFAAARRPPG